MKLLKLRTLFTLAAFAALGCSSGGDDKKDPPEKPDNEEDAGDPRPDAGFKPMDNDGGIDIDVPDAAVDAGPGPTFAVSGKLKIGPTLFRDSDSKDTGALYKSNDQLDVVNPAMDEAQEVTSPGTVTGYLGPMTFENDKQEVVEIDDNVDYYKVTLAEGQTVTLFTAEVAEDENGKKAAQADLDLFLLDAANADIRDGGSWVDDSLGIGDKEQVTAPRTDTYWLAVERFQDADDPQDDAAQAVYSLAVGIEQSGATMMDIARTKLSTQWDAVPGQALMQTSFGPQTAEVVREVTHLTYGQNAIGYALVSLNAVEQSKAARGRGDKRATVRAIKRLRKLGHEVTPNYVFQHMGLPAPNDPLFKGQWHYEQINLEEAWQQTDGTLNAKRGEGVVVAVLDTGVALSHPDFKNADATSQLTTDGFDMISDPETGADGDGRDNDADDPGDGRTPGDSSFHGTHCAGTIAASTGNSEGGAGVAPNATIMPIRVLGKGGGSLSDIIEGILYAAGLPNESGEVPTKKADIISMSLGGPGRSTAMAKAVASARAAGVIVIAAAGNSDAPAEVFSPAGEDGVVTVAATDFNKKRAFYSNKGSAIDIAAPGGDTGADENLDGQADGVISTVFKNDGQTKYAAYQGTSMACPHVAGVAALMKSVWKNMGPTEFDAAIANGDIVLPGTAEVDFGAGLLNANLAVSHALDRAGETVPLQPVLSVSSTVLDFGGAVSSLPLLVSNTGKGNLMVTSITPDQPWVDASGVSVGMMGEVLVDRNAASLVEGVNTANLTIVSNGGTKIVNVRVFKGTQLVGGDLDIVYVLMVDAESGEAAAQTFAVPKEEPNALPSYFFEIKKVPAGKFYLVAGTDLADTGFVGNDGDGYGAFPLSQDPSIICRFAKDGEPGCPELTAEQKAEELKNPDVRDVTVPMQILVDLGAEEAESAGKLSFSAASSATKRPTRVKRLW